MKTVVNGCEQDDFESILNNKLSLLERTLDNIFLKKTFSDRSQIIHKYYKAVEQALNNNYKLRFTEYPFFLKKDLCKEILDLRMYFTNGIFDIFEKSKINQHSVFCLSNFNNKNVAAFYLDGNQLTFVSIDQKEKQKIQDYLDDLNGQIEKLAIENNDLDIRESRSNAFKIDDLYRKSIAKKSFFDKCLVNKSIELPCDVSDLLQDVWGRIDSFSYIKNNIDPYIINFPDLFGDGERKSYFQKCMKKEGYGELTKVNDYMISILGYNGRFTAINLPTCFYLENEISYHINKVISQIYILNKAHTKNNQDELKRCLLELQKKLKKE